MAAIKAMVLRTAGTNCDNETCHAFSLAGAAAERMHVNRLIENPHLLDDYQILCVPGGFSYGDDISAGKILANQLIHHFRDAVGRFIAADKLVLGICNGFQVLVKAGFLPGGNGAADAQAAVALATITHNDSGKFEDRWVYLQPGGDNCVFIDPQRRLYLPIAHGEGKVCFRDEATYEQARTAGQIAFRYVDAAGNYGAYPVNPNGSRDHVAALTDATGRVLGMMPHPERFIHRTHHPRWTRQDSRDPDGLTIFHNAVRYFA